MNFLNRLLFVGALLICSTANAAVSDTDRAQAPFKNDLTNSGFENGKAGWTSSGGSFSTATSGSNFMGIGKMSGTWDSSSAAQTLTSTALTVSNGLAGTNGLFRCKVMTPSGTATHTMGLWDGSTLTQTISIPSSTTAQYVEIQVPFGAAATTVAIRFTSVASNEPLISIDDCYIGPNFNLSNVSAIGEWQSYTPTITGSTSGTFTPGGGVTPTGKWRRVGNNVEVSVQLTQTIAGTNGVGTAMFSMPPGIVADTSLHGVYTGSVASTAGSHAVDGNGSGNFAGGNLLNGSPFFVDSTHFGIAGDYQGANSGIWGSVIAGLGNADTIVSANLSVPVVGWSSASAVRADNSDWGWTDFGAVTIGAVTTPPTQVSNTKTADHIWGRRVGQNFEGRLEWIQTAAGSNTAGSGDYLFTIVPSASGCVIDTTKLTAYGGSSVGGGLLKANNSVGTGFASYAGTNEVAGGVYVYDSTTARLGGVVTTTSSSAGVAVVSSSFAPITGAVTYTANYSVPCVGWSVNQRTPLLVGSVTSNTTGMERVERAKINCNAASSVASQTGSWITAVSNITGSTSCTLTFAAGIFSSAPTCFLSWADSIPPGGMGLVPQTTSSSSLTSYCIYAVSGTAGCGNHVYNIMCMGPR